MSFDKHTAYLTYLAITKAGVLDAQIAAGIDFEDWPPSLPRLFMKELVDLHKAHGFDHASWKMKQGIRIDQLLDISDGFILPDDPHTVVPEYQKLLNEVRFEQLANDLSRSPQQGYELINSFLKLSSKQIEVKDLSKAFNDYNEEKKKRQAEGKTLVQFEKWRILSDKIGGFNPGRLGILMADSGFGKTALATQFAVDASEKIPTLFFNMEMSNYDFTHRLIACTTKSSFKDMHQPHWDEQWARAYLSKKQIYYTTGKDLTLLEIQAVARKYREEKNVELIIIDYDQKIILEDTKTEEWRQMHRIAVALEALAKELNCFVLLLAQTNFDGGISSSKRMTFPASTVMHFANDPNHGTYIRAIKNRWGPRNAAVQVEYRQEISSIIEKESMIWIDSKKQKIKE